MRDLTISEIEGQGVELLPERETLFFFGHNNFANVHATNTAAAVNFFAKDSIAAANAQQWVATVQG
jgi:hypothetical protein